MRKISKRIIIKILGIFFILLITISFLLISLFLGLFSQQFSQQILYSGNLDQPIGVVSVSTDKNPSIIFIIERGGIIKVIDSFDSKKEKIVLDISDKVYSVGEDGLLSIAIHPNFVVNHQVFLVYSSLNQKKTVSNDTNCSPCVDIHLSRFTIESTIEETRSSEMEFLKINQSSPFHRGGHIEFDYAGLLIMNIGDGDTVPYYAQDPTNLWGSIIRIDIDHSFNNTLYSIPVDNPFYNNSLGYREEIWAFGFRNPWRSTIDPVASTKNQTRIIVGDVGWNSFEEINIIEPGLNYGWPVMEGDFCLSYHDCDPSPYAPPLFTYGHESTNELDIPWGIAIIGGVVYQGEKFPSLYDKYIFADFRGAMWAMDIDREKKEVNSVEFLTQFTDTIVDISIDSYGELVITGILSSTLYGIQHRIVFYLIIFGTITSPFLIVYFLKLFQRKRFSKSQSVINPEL